MDKDQFEGLFLIFLLIDILIHNIDLHLNYLLLFLHFWNLFLELDFQLVLPNNFYKHLIEY